MTTTDMTPAALLADPAAGPCTDCGARPGEPCTTTWQGGIYPLTDVHPDRDRRWCWDCGQPWSGAADDGHGTLVAWCDACGGSDAW